MRSAFAGILVLFVLLPAVPTLHAQAGLLPSTTTPAPAKPAVPPDRLGRETPRGTVLGFVRSAQDENYKVAVQYFETPKGRRRPSVEDDQDLAAQLLSILNEKFGAASLDALSHSPDGTPDDGLPPDEEAIYGALDRRNTFTLSLIRVEDEQGVKLWYISRKTLERVPEAYDSLHFSQIEKVLPTVLVNHRPLSMPLWQWLAIFLFIPVALGLGWIIAQLIALLVRAWQKYRKQTPTAASVKFGPGSFLIAAIIHYRFVALIGASLLYRQYYRRVIWIFLAAATYWAFTRISRMISRKVGNQLTSRGKLAERSLVSLTRRVLDVCFFLLTALLVLSSMGVNVTAPLAGLGIGGLAIGLGAQKTFENLLGGISILADKALQAGDNCKIGDQVGTVEDIGLRSTKIRTPDRTLVSIPNGTVATAVLENYRLRDKMLCRQIVRLRYDMSPQHIAYVLEELRKVLAAHPKVENKTARARLIRFADYAFEVEIFAYILERENEAFLGEQENLILRIMNTLDHTGAGIALPSIASVVTQDSWVAPQEKKKTDASGAGEIKT
ncbi:MAG TPA: mechanosensitive ion channel domain-containing protein [Candidatus Dormibacteraeota bacterium]|nr:mechanosensitive ion channel domain-containing protein [Candidatus Dormibacteraeota bacterium]